MEGDRLSGLYLSHLFACSTNNLPLEKLQAIYAWIWFLVLFHLCSRKQFSRALPPQQRAKLLWTRALHSLQLTSMRKTSNRDKIQYNTSAMDEFYPLMALHALNGSIDLGRGTGWVQDVRTSLRDLPFRVCSQLCEALFLFWKEMSMHILY